MAPARIGRVAGDGVYRLPSLVRTCVVPAGRPSAQGLARVSWLTPYVAETVAEDARRAGPGTRLEVTVPAGTTTDGMSGVQRLFDWLIPEGIDVRVVRGTEDEEDDTGDD